MTENQENENEQKIFATVVLRSGTGESMFDKKNEGKLGISDFEPLSETFENAIKQLNLMGFTLVYRGLLHLTISSSPEVFEDIFGIQLEKEEYPLFFGKEQTTKEYYVYKKEIEVPEAVSEWVERITILTPPKLLASAVPPTPAGYDHIHVAPAFAPNDVSSLINAVGPHNRNWTGSGVRVAMVDTGFYNHPYFAAQGYSPVTVEVLNNLMNPTIDLIGHGTAMAANILAVAPSITLIMVKYMDLLKFNQLFFDPPSGFDKALQLTPPPDIITCSWEWNTTNRQPLETYIQAAVNSGITVVFACGNKNIDNADPNKPAWPGDMPEVISVGGAYYDKTKVPPDWVASSYACSGQSQNYPNRKVPDVCGIVGQSPRGIFIVMPTQESSGQDLGFSLGFIYPYGDETPHNDGWCVASGTSSATAQVAGVIALMLQKAPNLSPQLVKIILKATARDVKSGESASVDPANPPNRYKAIQGYDSATGWGVVDAEAALLDCFIATAAYGSRLAPEVQFLRYIRDSWISHSLFGKRFVDKAERIYYKYGPRIALAMKCNNRLKKILRWTVVAPIVKLSQLFVKIAERLASIQRRPSSTLEEGD